MSVLHAIILGIIQGLTEFLPISSSGHLVLVPALFKWADFESTSLAKTFDLALHVGTLVGAATYLRKDIAKYSSAAINTAFRRSKSHDSTVAWVLLISIVPAAIVGVAFESLIENQLSKPLPIALALIIFGVVLYLTDRHSQTKGIGNLKLSNGWLLGCAQAISLQPGVSRSGITISAGRLLGLDRESATRVSFLMLIPVVAGAALFRSVQVFAEGAWDNSFLSPFFWGMVSSGVTGYLAVFWLLRFVRTRTFLVFVIYRIALGVLILSLLATSVL